MKAHEANDRQIVMQAAEWQRTLQHADAKERDAFVGWLLESRRHVRNFLLLTAFDKELQQIDPQRRHGVEALLTHTTAVASLPRTQSFSRKRRPSPAFAAAAMLLVIAGTLWWSWSYVRYPSYATAIGEQRSVPLPDGSVVELNTHSKIRTRFSATTRTVRLLEGEALFIVRSDPARPFRVNIDEAVVKALGTQFNAYRAAGTTTISVSEGLVQIDPSGTRLKAGEQARILPSHKVVRLTTADVPRALAWRERRLIFRNDRLADIAAEFNRYNSAEQMRVEGAAIRDRRITGIFAADDPELLVKFLASDETLAVDRNGERIVIREH